MERVDEVWPLVRASGKAAAKPVAKVIAAPKAEAPKAPAPKPAVKKPAMKKTAAKSK